MQQQQTISQSDGDRQWKVHSIGPTWPAQWLDQEEAPKHFPKPNLHQKKGHGHCLVVCCPSDPLQLSESRWNRYIWKECKLRRCTENCSACSQHWSAARAQFFSMTTPDHTANASTVEWIGLWSFASSAVFTDLSPTDYHFFKRIDNFLWKNASTASRMLKILSTSLLNPEAWIFMLQK